VFATAGARGEDLLGEGPGGGSGSAGLCSGVEVPRGGGAPAVRVEVPRLSGVPSAVPAAEAFAARGRALGLLRVGKHVCRRAGGAPGSGWGPGGVDGRGRRGKERPGTWRQRGLLAVAARGWEPRGARAALPRGRPRSTVAGVVGAGFASACWMTFLLVPCSFAVCFNNCFLPIAQWFLFSCLNRAAAFTRRANIAACASSFPCVMV